MWSRLQIRVAYTGEQLRHWSELLLSSRLKSPVACRWCWTPPPVWLLAPASSTALLRFFATSSIGCQCLNEYSSRWHPPLMTVFTALGQPTSRTYARWWSTSLVGQTSVRLNAATCLCHGRGPNLAYTVSTSQLQLSGTRFQLISAQPPFLVDSSELYGFKTYLFNLAFYTDSLWEILLKSVLIYLLTYLLSWSI